MGALRGIGTRNCSSGLGMSGLRVVSPLCSGRQFVTQGHHRAPPDQIEAKRNPLCPPLHASRQQRRWPPQSEPSCAAGQRRLLPRPCCSLCFLGGTLRYGERVTQFSFLAFFFVNLAWLLKPTNMVQPRSPLLAAAAAGLLDVRRPQLSPASVPPLLRYYSSKPSKVIKIVALLF